MFIFFTKVRLYCSISLKFIEIDILKDKEFKWIEKINPITQPSIQRVIKQDPRGSHQ